MQNVDKGKALLFFGLASDYDDYDDVTLANKAKEALMSRIVPEGSGRRTESREGLASTYVLR
jgi:hypothetical protein